MRVVRRVIARCKNFSGGPRGSSGKIRLGGENPGKCLPQCQDPPRAHRVTARGRKLRLNSSLSKGPALSCENTPNVSYKISYVALLHRGVNQSGAAVEMGSVMRSYECITACVVRDRGCFPESLSNLSPPEPMPISMNPCNLHSSVYLV